MSQLKTYIVAMIVSEVWHITVDAVSEEDAKVQAQASHEEHGCDEFSFKDSDVDGFEIVEEEEVQS
jgi:hypothetical protein